MRFSFLRYLTGNSEVSEVRCRSIGLNGSEERKGVLQKGVLQKGIFQKGVPQVPCVPSDFSLEEGGWPGAFKV